MRLQSRNQKHRILSGASETTASRGSPGLRVAGGNALTGRRLAAPRSRDRPRRTTVWLLVATAVVGCSHSSSSAASADVERARALLDPAAALPPRNEAVAVAEQVAIASSNATKQGRTTEGGELARLAADLR